jgi:hypothetical protein
MPQKKGSVKIDTVPLPERPVALEIKIPVELIREFEKEVRIVVRHPWIIGIPLPERLLKPEILDKLGPNLDIMITPKR